MHSGTGQASPRKAAELGGGSCRVHLADVVVERGICAPEEGAECGLELRARRRLARPVDVQAVAEPEVATGVVDEGICLRE